MLEGLQFDPLADGACARRVVRHHDLREGEWNTLLDISGPGMITHLWFTFPTGDKMLGRRSLLRIFWDDEPEPSVVAPLTDFFGVPFGFTGAEHRLSSRYLVVAPQNGLNCYFKMPFATRARIEILPEQTEGGGGDTFLIDGETHPHVLHGIGAEDFFGQSWGVSTFQSPVIGTPWREANEDGDATRVALYRFFVDDPIPFRSSIRGELGALANNYSSVAYWLQEEPHTPFFDVPEADKRMPHSSAPYGVYDIEPAEAIEWRLLAPFAINDESTFDDCRSLEVEENGPEEFVYSAEGEPSLPGGNEMAVKWRPQSDYHGFIDFHFVGRPAVTCIRLQIGVLGHALTYLESKEDRDVTVHVGFDDEISIRVNTDVVYTGAHWQGFHEVSFAAGHRKPRR